MGVKTTSVGTNTTQAPDAASRPGATIAMTVGAPVAYAALFNLSFRTDENPFDGPDGLMLLTLLVLKLLAVVSLVVGLHRIGTRIATSPAVARVAAVIWAFVGVTLTAVVAGAKNQGVPLGIDQLWPGQSDAELLDNLDPGPGLGWNPTSIMTAEIVAVLLLATGVAFLLRRAGGHVTGGRHERRVVTALTMVGFFGGLVVYDQIVGWPVMFDFDPFVGDAVLGALTYELTFLPGPIDPVGAIALAAIAVANGLILIAARWIRIESPEFARQFG